MSGILSQSTKNLEDCINQITSIFNLPQDAIAVQSEISALLLGVKNNTLVYQKGMFSCISEAAVELKNVSDGVSNGKTPFDIATTTIADAMSKAEEIKKSTDEQRDVITTGRDKMNKFVSQLSAIENRLNSQIPALQSQLSNANSQLAVAQKRYYWLLALGPFGLPGIAAAAVLCSKWKSEAASLLNQINSLNNQIASHKSMFDACKTFMSNSNNIWNVFSGIENDIDIIISTYNNVQENLKSSQDMNLLKLFLTASVPETLTLQNDLS